jgi:hypothetical protein
MQVSTHDDRNWEAFRYVCGEMTEEDRQSFELRLAEDESLCDEVARAVELNEAIRLSSAKPIDVHHSAWDALPLRSVMWGAALAASVLLALFVGRADSIRRGTSDGAAPSVAASPGEPQRGLDPRGVEAGVSLVWADLQRRDDGGAAAGRWGGPTGDAGFEDFQAGLEDPAEGMPPQWLLTAVAGGSKEAKETP